MSHSKGSGRHQHVAKREIPSHRGEKILEMTSGFYDSGCAVECGKIMVCLVWFGLVFEKERSQATLHQGVVMLGLRWTPQ